MTNFEKYKDDITTVGARFGISCGKPVSCRLIKCDSCEINKTPAGSIDCIPTRWEWLISEYEEPKISIPKDTQIDTKVLVSQDGESWRRRYYAGFKDGKHYAWRIGCTSWSTVELDDFDNNTVIHKVPWEYMKLAEEEE